MYKAFYLPLSLYNMMKRPKNNLERLNLLKGTPARVPKILKTGDQKVVDRLYKMALDRMTMTQTFTVKNNSAAQLTSMSTITPGAVFKNSWGVASWTGVDVGSYPAPKPKPQWSLAELSHEIDLLLKIVQA